jgi:hypothetical protein
MKEVNYLNFEWGKVENLLRTRHFGSLPLSLHYYPIMMTTMHKNLFFTPTVFLRPTNSFLHPQELWWWEKNFTNSNYPFDLCWAVLFFRPLCSSPPFHCWEPLNFQNQNGKYNLAIIFWCNKEKIVTIFNTYKLTFFSPYMVNQFFISQIPEFCGFFSFLCQ